mgnify:CR=1 FL=1
MSPVATCTPTARAVDGLDWDVAALPTGVQPVAVRARQPRVREIEGERRSVTGRADCPLFERTGGRLTLTPDGADLTEDEAYPAQPDNEYGWEKLFSERLYLAYHRNHGMESRVARFHNIFGPQGTWMGGREKAPAALCRKIAEAPDGGEIEIWGDGMQTRDYVFVGDVVRANLAVLGLPGFRTFNVGTGVETNVNELFDRLRSAIGTGPPADHGPAKAGEQMRSCITSALLEQELEGSRPAEIAVRPAHSSSAAPCTRSRRRTTSRTHRAIFS